MAILTTFTKFQNIPCGRQNSLRLYLNIIITSMSYGGQGRRNRGGQAPPKFCKFSGKNILNPENFLVYPEIFFHI